MRRAAFGAFASLAALLCMSKTFADVKNSYYVPCTGVSPESAVTSSSCEDVGCMWKPRNNTTCWEVNPSYANAREGGAPHEHRQLQQNGWTCWRFQVTDLDESRTGDGPGCPGCVQMAELNFFDQSGDRIFPEATISELENSPPGEEPFKASDGDSSSKWLSFVTTDSLFLSFLSPQAFTTYSYVTANDVPRRDPYSWIVSYSDCEVCSPECSFTIADTRTEQMIPVDRFTETTRYTLGPTITVAEVDEDGNIIVEEQSPNGAVVTYTATATDIDGNELPPPVCTPASGSTFAPGPTAVTCEATDSTGYRQYVFQVIVVSQCCRGAYNLNGECIACPEGTYQPTYNPDRSLGASACRDCDAARPFSDSASVWPEQCHETPCETGDYLLYCGQPCEAPSDCSCLFDFQCISNKPAGTTDYGQCVAGPSRRRLQVRSVLEGHGDFR